MLKINALNYIINMCISQSNNEERLRSVIFYSRKIISAKLNYKIYNKKLLIIVAAFDEWRVYLKEFKYSVKVYIDYKNLLYFITIKMLNRR